jgi:hypothetical protein
VITARSGWTGCQAPATAVRRDSPVARLRWSRRAWCLHRDAVRCYRADIATSRPCRARIGGMPAAMLCYRMYDACRPLADRDPGQPTELDMTCITSGVYGRRGTGTAPARRRAKRRPAGHHGTLASPSERTRRRVRTRQSTNGAPKDAVSRTTAYSSVRNSQVLVWRPSASPGLTTSASSGGREGFAVCTKLARRTAGLLLPPADTPADFQNGNISAQSSAVHPSFRCPRRPAAWQALEW